MSPRLAPVAPLLLLASCIANPVVQTDHDAAVAFGNYTRYAWREQPGTASPLVRQRIVEAIDAQLQGKGWRLVPETEADAVLAAHVASREKYNIRTFYDEPAWHDWHWYGVQNVGAGRATTNVTSYTVGTLVIDIFDARTKRAIWRATAEGTVPETPAKINASIDETIPRMFTGFPP
jgi:hypothetical protein